MYIQTPHQSHRYAFKCNINSVKSKIYDWNKTHSAALCQFSFVSCKAYPWRSRCCSRPVWWWCRGMSQPPEALPTASTARTHPSPLNWNITAVRLVLVVYQEHFSICWQGNCMAKHQFHSFLWKKAAVLICSLTCWHPPQSRRRSRGGEGGDKERRERGETWRHTELQLESHTTSPARIRYKKEKVSSAVWRRERWEVWFLWLVLDTRPESLSSL